MNLNSGEKRFSLFLKRENLELAEKTRIRKRNTENKLSGGEGGKHPQQKGNERTGNTRPKKESARGRVVLQKARTEKGRNFFLGYRARRPPPRRKATFHVPGTQKNHLGFRSEPGNRQEKKKKVARNKLICLLLRQGVIKERLK